MNEFFFAMLQSSCFTLDIDWVSCLIGVSITYVVFIMGVPALISQTFIPEPLRDLYKKRMMKGWLRVFEVQMFLILLMVVFSNPGFYAIEKKEEVWVNNFAVLLLFFLFLVVVLGHIRLIKDLVPSQHTGLRLSKIIVNDALAYYKEQKEVTSRDVSDLKLLARELSRGMEKELFLAECERLVEGMLKETSKPEEIITALRKVLQEVVGASIRDGDQVSTDDICKAIAILSLAYRQAKQRIGIAFYSDFISELISEIGEKALRLKDQGVVTQTAFNTAVDNLAGIDEKGISREMFKLGYAALRRGYYDATVKVLRKLGDRVQNEVATSGALGLRNRRAYAWIGLIACIWLKEGYTREYAERQLNNILSKVENPNGELKAFFENAQSYFYTLTDFSTADSIRDLQKSQQSIFSAKFN